MSEKRVYIYYGILMVIMMSWHNSYAPNTLLRIAYLIAVVLPALRFNQAILPAAITCFWGVSMYGYSYSYMPTMHYLYAILVIILYVLEGRKADRTKIPQFKYLWFFLVYLTFIDLITNTKMSNMSYSFFVMLLLPYLINDKNERVVDYFEIGFIIMSLVLSYYSLTTRDMFIKTGQDYERVSWMDQNYLGTVIAMGAAISFRRILHLNNYKAFSIALFAITFALSSMAILLLGSRGASLCLVGCISVFLLRSRTKKVMKYLILILFIVFIYYLYTHEYFYILQTRIQEDDGTGSNRTYIWLVKLSVFFDKTPIQWLFGMGNRKALEIICFPGDTITAFHNDFIATLVSYGLLGFGFLLYMFYLPIKMAKKHKQALPEIIALLFFLGLSFMTLEPFTQADFPFFAFYLYILFVAKYGMHDSVIKIKH